MSFLSPLNSQRQPCCVLGARQWMARLLFRLNLDLSKDLALPRGISGIQLEMICDSRVISEDNLGRSILRNDRRIGVLYPIISYNPLIPVFRNRKPQGGLVFFPNG